MKRSLYRNFDCYRNLPADFDNTPKLPVPMEIETVETPRSSLLKAIYAVDPLTRLPTGDIACYVSSETSPQVKQFILDNIMVDTSRASLPPAPAGMSDDELAEYSRRDGESTMDYANRMSNYARSLAGVVQQASRRKESVKESVEPKTE